jgi:hypothetical protein
MVPETRTRAVTYCVQMPVTRTVSEQYQVQVPTYREIQQTYTVCMPVWTDQTRQYTVMVPQVETRQATRQVVHCIPVSETRTVCVDRGHWEEACASPCSSGCDTCDSSCGGCRSRRGGGCGDSCCAPARRWVCNYIQEQVPVTVMKTECVSEPYQYQVTVCHPETRTCTVKVCSYVNQTRTATQRVCEYKCETRTCNYNVTECKVEQRTREVPYTVCVAQTRTRQEQVCEYKQVAVEKTEQYTVMVPHEVEQDVQVQVCRMVPKTVTVQVDNCCNGSSCGSCQKCIRSCGRRSCGGC